MDNKNKIIIFSLAGLVILLLGAFVFLLFRGAPATKKDIDQRVDDKVIQIKQGEEAAKETKKILDESQKILDQVKAGEDSMVKEVEISRNGQGTSTERAIQIASGTSPISIVTGEVINIHGNVADNISAPGSQEAPQQSFPVKADKLPASTLKVVVTPTSITPASFKVKAGQLVSLAVTAGGGDMANFRFASPLLTAVYVGLGVDETRVVNFNAPTVAGEYEYYSDFKSFKANGAVGKMIVE